ncbi:MAG: hybrid sensor histidine kinase/response regulator [Bdellovibrionales bacterium]|nr:hybrid sensor histidine kinase/response regulator [Bdellovibrionales bacterium]
MTNETQEELRIYLIDDSIADIDYFIELCKRFEKFKAQVHYELDFDLQKHQEEIKNSDIVFCDYQMMPQNGVEIVKNIRSQQIDIPIIMLTGRGDEKTAVSSFKSGVQDYLIKEQINTTRLEKSIQLVLDHYRIEQTKQHAIEAQKESIKALQDINRHKSEFVSVVSHEIRTPLTVVKEYCSLLYEGSMGALSKEQKEALSACVKNCNRLTDLINDVLDLEKINSGRLEVIRKKGSIDKLLTSIVEQFQKSHRNRKIRLKMDENLPDVFMDESKIFQVMMNLMGNALKFTPEEGEVFLEVEKKENGIEISVKDKGPGISQENQIRVFDSFVQINRKYKPGKQGTGLGLAISKKLVEMHGSELKLISEIGKGATFCFQLPLYQNINPHFSSLIDRLRSMKNFQESSDSIGLVIFKNHHMGSDNAPIWERIQQIARKDEVMNDYLEQGYIILMIKKREENLRSIVHRFVKPSEEDQGIEVAHQNFEKRHFNELSLQAFCSKLKGSFKVET